MTFRDEISAAIAGSMALLRAEPTAMQHFDVSIAGFWRSFRVALIVAPTLVLDELAERRLVGELGRTDPDLIRSTAESILNYIAGYTVFPLVLLVLAGPLGLRQSFVPFLIARNWSTLVGIVPATLVALAYVVGLFGHEAYFFGNWAALVFNLFYAWRVARIAAAVPPGQAAGLVALDLILILIVNSLINRIA